MNQDANEEVAWQRLKDLQREYEYSRLMSESGPAALARLGRILAQRVWWLAGLAMHRAPRRTPARPVKLVSDDCENRAAAPEVA